MERRWTVCCLSESLASPSELELHPKKVLFNASLTVQGNKGLVTSRSYSCSLLFSVRETVIRIGWK